MRIFAESVILDALALGATVTVCIGCALFLFGRSVSNGKNKHRSPFLDGRDRN